MRRMFVCMKTNRQLQIIKHYMLREKAVANTNDASVTLVYNR